ncbi:hypothetical protein MKX03_005779, partial [Papaver bracteatum]
MTTEKTSFQRKIDILAAHLRSETAEVNAIVQKEGLASVLVYMTNLTMEFLQRSFQSELLAYQIRDQLNAEVNAEGGNDGIEAQNQVDVENQGDNGGLELEEYIIIPSNDEEAMNLNSNEGACGLEINFPMLNVQNIFKEMDVSGSE